MQALILPHPCVGIKSSKYFFTESSHDAFYQNCTIGYAPPNKGSARALDMKRL